MNPQRQLYCIHPGMLSAQEHLTQSSQELQAGWKNKHGHWQGLRFQVMEKAHSILSLPLSAAISPRQDAQSCTWGRTPECEYHQTPSVFTPVFKTLIDVGTAAATTLLGDLPFPLGLQFWEDGPTSCFSPSLSCHHLASVWVQLWEVHGKVGEIKPQLSSWRCEISGKIIC